LSTGVRPVLIRKLIRPSPAEAVVFRQGRISMDIEQTIWSAEQGWQPPPNGLGTSARLVLVFGGTSILEQAAPLADLRKVYPNAHLMGCSTAGEICGTRVLDDSLVATAVRFDHTELVGARVVAANAEDSYGAGQRLAEQLPPEHLRHVFVLSEGLDINGSDLVRGLASRLPDSVTVTGGLSGDGGRFGKTLVVSGTTAERHTVAALGLYGDRLRIGYGSLGGWDSFGPERIITKSSGCVLYQLDDQSALELYKRYLGDQAKDLPASGLLFPLAVRGKDDTEAVVRTILAVNEADQSITFAGDLPQGGYARLMKANFDRLIDGAIGAARVSYEALGSSNPDLAILISCVGRKMVLGQRVEEEIEGVRDVFGPDTVLAGFYSYGEISPFTAHARCELHNQTMTVTTLSER
jgi:hypothetical protein